MPSNASRKRCSRCRRVKLVSEFHRRSNRPDGRASHCVLCHRGTYDTDVEARRDRTLRRRYGISAADYDAMADAQGHCCALCGRESSDARRLHVDHDHDTKVVRGLLCFRCNTTLGALQRIGLARVAAYLARSLERMA